MGDELPHRCDTTTSGDTQSSIERVCLVLELGDRTLEQHRGLAGSQGAHVGSEFAVLISALLWAIDLPCIP